jgi:predicted GIY-YIG superfamily endonuclease
MYYVYVIQNESGVRYLGFTSCLKTRLDAHNQGLVKSTKGHEWEFVYYEAYKSEEDARRRERNLKKSGQARRWLKERISTSVQL